MTRSTALRTAARTGSFEIFANIHTPGCESSTPCTTRGGGGDGIGRYFRGYVGGGQQKMAGLTPSNSDAVELAATEVEAVRTSPSSVCSIPPGTFRARTLTPAPAVRVTFEP